MTVKSLEDEGIQSLDPGLLGNVNVNPVVN
jgi:hypothetical protein